MNIPEKDSTAAQNPLLTKYTNKAAKDTTVKFAMWELAFHILSDGIRTWRATEIGILYYQAYVIFIPFALRNADSLNAPKIFGVTETCNSISSAVFNKQPIIFYVVLPPK
jgi:hypothetical protein